MKPLFKRLLYAFSLLLFSAVSVKALCQTHLTLADFNSKVADLNASEWKYLGDKPAIIDFYATWCGPCKKLSPIIEELAHDYKGSIYVYKVDTDKERKLSSLFGISSIPTLIFIPMEGTPYVMVGGASKEELTKMIKEKLLR